MPVDNGNGTIDSALNDACVKTGQRAPGTTQPPSYNPQAIPPLADACLLLVPIAAPPNPAGSAQIVLLGCFSMYQGRPAYEEWRGILHPLADCAYSVFVPNWTWDNSGPTYTETRVLVSL
jgi:hypothetical protein